MLKQQPPLVFVAVLDAIGISTLEGYLENVQPSTFHLPHLSLLGLGNLSETLSRFVEPVDKPELAFAAEPSSTWADSVMGHRELLGYVDPQDYVLFRSGFPATYVEELERRIRLPVTFNERAGGDDAIARGNAKHQQTKGVILYASMCDPLVQLAADELVIAPEQLSGIAQIAFDLAMEQQLQITRVITRPYVVGANGGFTRTQRRRDIVKPLPSGVTTLIDLARDYDVETLSIGKCSDVVNSTWDRTLDLNGHIPSVLEMMYTPRKKDKNPYSMLAALDYLHGLRSSRDKPTFIMCNFPDTDSLFGHNRKPEGALASLAAFDQGLGLLLNALPSNSYLLITGDHGMRDGGDYGYHSREAVHVLGKSFNAEPLDFWGVQRAASYAVVGQLCARIFGFEKEYLQRCHLERTLRELG